MLFAYDDVKLAMGIPFSPKLSVTGWNRLEGRPRTENFERALRAEVRDPLWFLARQWQFLELKADDAGSPIEARAALRETLLTAYAPAGGPPQAFPDDLPLETIVEREAPPMDRVSHMQLFRAVDKALQRAGATPGERGDVLHFLRDAYPFSSARAEGVDDEQARQLALLADRHLFDGSAFLAEAGPAFEARADASPLLSPATRTLAKASAAAAADWFRELYCLPPAGAGAWNPQKLDYGFACATAAGAGQTVLVADGYADGSLDWFDVDVAAVGAALDPPAAAQPAPVTSVLSMLPAPVSFPGMPSPRFWEMENRKVEFGDITAGTTDIGKLLLTEFMLVYANDWCIIPFEVSVGAIAETLGIVVRDVFGDRTLVRAADRGQDEDWRRWAMFNLETLDAGDRPPPRLFLAPATPKLLEGPAIERVVFLRDEMANMVWAVERTVASAAGGGIEGEPYAQSLVPPPPEPLPVASGATVRYRLGTGAPPNWRPFVPAHVPGSQRSIRLQRARLPGMASEPLGRVIAEPAPYFINEEEVPRAGRIVTRSFQRSRWTDGRVVLWLGRRTTTGRGEGSSGLAFDTLEEIPSRS